MVVAREPKLCSNVKTKIERRVEARSEFGALLASCGTIPIVLMLLESLCPQLREARS